MTRLPATNFILGLLMTNLPVRTTDLEAISIPPFRFRNAHFGLRIELTAALRFQSAIRNPQSAIEMAALPGVGSYEGGSHAIEQGSCLVRPARERRLWRRAGKGWDRRLAELVPASGNRAAVLRGSRRRAERGRGAGHRRQ